MGVRGWFKKQGRKAKRGFEDVAKETEKAAQKAAKEADKIARDAAKETERAARDAAKESDRIAKKSIDEIERAAKQAGHAIEGEIMSVIDDVKDLANKAKREIEDAGKAGIREIESTANSAKNEITAVADDAKREVRGAANDAKKELEGAGGVVEKAVTEQLPDAMEKAFTESLPALMETAMNALVSEGIKPVLKAQAKLAREFADGMDKVAADAPNLVGELDNLGFDIELKVNVEINLEYASFWTRAREVAGILDRYGNDGLELRRRDIRGFITALGPDSISFGGGASLSFGLDIGGVAKAKSISLALFVELADYVMKEAGVPE